MEYVDFLKEYEPFSLSQQDKRRVFSEALNKLTLYHQNNCKSYRNILKALDYEGETDDYVNLPFLPVRVFKEMDLRSCTEDEVFKTMTSSGTSGQAVSKIYLDKETAANQQKTLARIVSEYTGGHRLPMLIIDCPSVLKKREMFSARGAGILGFSIFGKKKIYALNDDMELEVDKVAEFLAEHQGEKILLFGFTFMIWQHFYKTLKEQGVKLDLGNGVLIHGGGWKKLQQEAVSPLEFRKALQEVCGITEVHNYYGMVEQTGCICMECEEGHLHVSSYSDIIIRRGRDFSVADIGEKGIIQVISLLPKSYPGHSLLTEDEGVILGVDDCPCGRKGKYFEILGRLKNAEIRGCSDTYADKF
ncbi:LuxE/PaaK family acyltransferase [Selenomonas ruminantium]|uniref:Phenylacetate-coenzyme A ligase PaaK, adenylate-forming domain family n=1 Tax=Selenomonas ruminantium TaxID=971 RepID=A0A1H0S2Q3_SELRU|nr:acyl-protein synthetase [Selenomonas ruminantium]SDP35937.1 Phenylacetate-coenzyme A ligase PaaK, adenylate-forming domain family [Selenomonas ruminantium]